MAQIPKNLRSKKRYLLIKAKTRKDIENSLLNGIGELGISKARPFFVEERENYFILGIERDYVDAIRSSFEIDKNEIRIEKVSGTLKGLGIKNKKAQIQMSFTMIFSIIIIIATLAVAFYVIKTFVWTSECAKIQSFYEEMREDVDKVWRSAASQERINAEISGSVEWICVGDASLLDRTKYAEQYEALRRYSRNGDNLFVYPIPEGCDPEVVSYKMQNVNIESPFCIESKNNKVSMLLTKESTTDKMVTIKP